MFHSVIHPTDISFSVSGNGDFINSWHGYVSVNLYSHESIVLLGITVPRRRARAKNIIIVVVVVVVRVVTADIIGTDLSHKDSPRPMMMTTTTTITMRRLLRETLSLPLVLISAGRHKLLYSSSRSRSLSRNHSYLIHRLFLLVTILLPALFLRPPARSPACSTRSLLLFRLRAWNTKSRVTETRS